MTFAERRRLELDYKEWLKRESIAKGVAVQDCALTVIGYLDSKGLINKIPKWIPVSEKLPEDDTRVLITTTSVLGTEHIVLEVSYLNGVFLRGFSSYTPSAWMPLPKPYKEGVTE